MALQKLLNRLLALIPVWLCISLLAFSLSALAPGDPAAQLYIRLYGQPHSDQSALNELRAEYGFDDPFWLRYGRWTLDAAQGSLGNSYQSGQPVMQELIVHFGSTLKIALSGFFVAIIVAIPLGVVAAHWRDKLPDFVARVAALIGVSVPAYWLAYMLILLFSVKLRWLPVAGTGSWRHLLLPAVTMGLGGAAVLSRLLRSSLLEVLNQDYIRTAQSKGLSYWRGVFLRHALPNALVPVVTVSGNLFGYLLSGAVVVETVFAWPGIGRLIIDAIVFRDYPVIQGFVLFTGTLFVLLNLCVDLSYGWLDPRIQLGESVA